MIDSHNSVVPLRPYKQSLHNSEDCQTGGSIDRRMNN